MPWVESSPFRNWVEWTWVDPEKCQIQGRQHIDFDPSPFDPIRPQSIRPQSIRPKLFDQKGRPNSFRPISFDPFHAIRSKGSTSVLSTRKIRPIYRNSGRFGKRRFGKNMAAGVSAKKYAETSQAKKFAETFRMIYAMYARSPSPSQRPASTISVPARSFLLFDLA